MNDIYPCVFNDNHECVLVRAIKVQTHGDRHRTATCTAFTVFVAARLPLCVCQCRKSYLTVG